jgi:hypothetical protein
MKIDPIGIMLTVAGVAAMLGLLSYVAYMAVTQPHTHRVDCSLASFHPDFTPAMRKQCRGEKP